VSPTRARRDLIPGFDTDGFRQLFDGNLVPRLAHRDLINID